MIELYIGTVLLFTTLFKYEDIKNAFKEWKEERAEKAAEEAFNLLPKKERDRILRQRKREYNKAKRNAITVCPYCSSLQGYNNLCQCVFRRRIRK